MTLGIYEVAPIPKDGILLFMYVILLEMTGVFNHTIEHAQTMLGGDLEHYVGNAVGVITNDGDSVGQTMCSYH